MIDVKEAVKISLNFFKDIYEARYDKLALEEVELTQDGKYWLITLGYDVEVDHFPIASIVRNTRQYKVLKIDSDSGKVWSMNIRTVE